MANDAFFTNQHWGRLPLLQLIVVHRIVVVAQQQPDPVFVGLRVAVRLLEAQFQSRQFFVGVARAALVRHYNFKRVVKSAFGQRRWRDVLRFYAEWTRDLPDELTTMARFLVPMAAWDVPEELKGRPVLSIGVRHS